jgi:hypothetical protein
MAESRFGLRIPIAVAETRRSVVRGERGRDETATQVRGGTTGLSVRSSCRRFGRSPKESSHHSRSRRPKVRPGLMAVSRVCHSAVCCLDSRTARSSAD